MSHSDEISCSYMFCKVESHRSEAVTMVRALFTSTQSCDTYASNSKNKTVQTTNNGFCVKMLSAYNFVDNFNLILSTPGNIYCKS